MELQEPGHAGSAKSSLSGFLNAKKKNGSEGCRAAGFGFGLCGSWLVQDLETRSLVGSRHEALNLSS